MNTELGTLKYAVIVFKFFKFYFLMTIGIIGSITVNRGFKVLCINE